MNTETPLVQSGIIGFFDILGYENYLHHNEPEEAARTVLAFLPRAGSQAVEKLLKMFPDVQKTDPSAEARFREIRWVVFSDTVLASLSFSEPEAIKDRKLACRSFTAAMSVFCRHMFAAGLPVRGVINFGDFVVQEACFAGRCIIDAYSFGKKLELAACVVHPLSEEQFKATRGGLAPDRLVFPYQIPTKDNSANRLLTLNYVTWGKELGFEDMSGQDIRQAVLSAFWRHNKDLPLSAMNKLENTEVLIRHFKERYPADFR
jgi:hypothetical protein